jgi:hypothetical protein
MTEVFTMSVRMSLLVLGLAAAAFTAQKASAQDLEIPTGVYKGETNEKQKLFVKGDKTASGIEYFAMLSLGGDRQTGLFKIDTTVEGIVQLVRLYVNDKGILTSAPHNQPSFGAMMAINNDGKAMLILTATPTGRSSGCPESIRLKWDSDPDQLAWTHLLGFNAMKLRINKDSEIDMIMQSRGGLREYNVTLTGADDLKSSWAGSYKVTEWVPGIGLMRKRDFSSLSVSGTVIGRNVETVLVPMRSSSGKPALRFVRMQANDSSCVSPSSTIK